MLVLSLRLLTVSPAHQAGQPLIVERLYQKLLLYEASEDHMPAQAVLYPTLLTLFGWTRQEDRVNGSSPVECTLVNNPLSRLLAARRAEGKLSNLLELLMRHIDAVDGRSHMALPALQFLLNVTLVNPLFRTLLCTTFRVHSPLSITRCSFGSYFLIGHRPRFQLMWRTLLSQAPLPEIGSPELVLHNLSPSPSVIGLTADMRAPRLPIKLAPQFHYPAHCAALSHKLTARVPQSTIALFSRTRFPWWRCSGGWGRRRQRFGGQLAIPWLVWSSPISSTVPSTCAGGDGPESHR